MCDDGFGWFEAIQVLAALATVGALVFTGLELRATARERRKLELRLQHERLEELLLAIVDTDSWVAAWNEPKIRQCLRGLEARLAGFVRDTHEQAWLLAGMKDHVNTDNLPKLRALLERAESETWEAIRKLSLERLEAEQR